MDESIVVRLAQLRAFVGQFESALTAYSGGVDSALVMKVAHEVLGDRALACIGVSPSYPLREQRGAIELAERIGAPYRLVYPNEIENPSYAANPNNRCYFCKTELHDEMQALARGEGYAVVFDGTNADDVKGGFRPGIRAAREHGVRSPLLEAGITKAEVREIAHYLGLPVWDKPAMACMSSRVPHGVAITPALLKQIEAAEDFLYDLGLRQFRVRHHQETARIEVPVDAFEVILTHRDAIVRHFQSAGYTFVSLDLAGFNSGSMNATRLSAGVIGVGAIPVQ